MVPLLQAATVTRVVCPTRNGAETDPTSDLAFQAHRIPPGSRDKNGAARED
jgi:hypothetical protein